MMARMPGEAEGESIGVHSQRSLRMKWETPQAVELRFGMEITMYVANR
jgi:coenzyme PQQ precursor peptide PqqA